MENNMEKGSSIMRNKRYGEKDYGKMERESSGYRLKEEMKEMPNLYFLIFLS